MVISLLSDSEDDVPPAPPVPAPRTPSAPAARSSSPDEGVQALQTVTPALLATFNWHWKGAAAGDQRRAQVLDICLCLLESVSRDGRSTSSLATQL